MVTEQDYNKIANAAYNVDSSKVKVPLSEGKEILGGKYQILKVEDNTANGMQAMAVAPVDKDDHVNTSQVVIAYAGTNKSDPDDIATDVQSLGMATSIII